jgi:hypothetical protein
MVTFFAGLASRDDCRSFFFSTGGFEPEAFCSIVLDVSFFYFYPRVGATGSFLLIVFYLGALFFV